MMLVDIVGATRYENKPVALTYENTGLVGWVEGASPKPNNLWWVSQRLVRKLMFDVVGFRKERSTQPTVIDLNVLILDISDISFHTILTIPHISIVTPISWIQAILHIFHKTGILPIDG